MRIGRRSEKVARTEINNQKRTLGMVAIIILTIAIIAWVAMVGRQAQRTVAVAMTTQDIYKNQAITQEMFIKYDMLEGEFNKYAVQTENGTTKRRIILWEEIDKVIGGFAAYPIQKNTVAMYNNFIKSRIDNSDSVMYSYPGKVIIDADIATSDLEAYKTFLQPGDRINIEAIYVDNNNITTEDGSKYSVDTVRSERLFTDVMVADLLNDDGDSILDIYESYKDKTVYEQAQLDSSDEFRKSVTPSHILLALTPEELKEYYDYSSKNCEFKMSLPQRVE